MSATHSNVKRRTNIRHALTTVLIICAVLSAGSSAVLGYWIWGQSPAPTGTVELLRFSLQVVLATVVGTMGSLLVAEFNRERSKADQELLDEKQRQRATHDFVRDILQRATSAYYGVKGLRRIVRGRCRMSDPTRMALRLGTYHWFIENLNRRQLELEGIVEDLNQSPTTADWVAPCKQLLRKIETHLRLVIEEYERDFPRIRRENLIGMNELPRFERFVLPSDSPLFTHTGTASPFKTEVQRPFATLRQRLRAEMLTPRSTSVS